MGKLFVGREVALGLLLLFLFLFSFIGGQLFFRVSLQFTAVFNFIIFFYCIRQRLAILITIASLTYIYVRKLLTIEKVLFLSFFLAVFFLTFSVLDIELFITIVFYT